VIENSCAQGDEVSRRCVPMGARARKSREFAMTDECACACVCDDD